MDTILVTRHLSACGGKDDVEADMAELRTATVKLFVWATGALAFGIIFHLGMVANRADVPMLAIAGSLAVNALIAGTVAQKSARGAAALLLAGLLATEFAAQLLFPGTSATWATPLVVFAGVGSLGLLGGASVAVVSSVIPAVISGVSGSIPVLLLVWGAYAVGWLSTAPFRVAVAWASRSADAARRHADDARAAQAELARLSRSLRQSLAQLKRANEELERARVAAEEAQKRKIEFATTVSHELRTPLNLIVGFSEMMVLNPQTYGGDRLPDSYRGDIEVIYRNACHLSNLIDDVLDLSQIDARRMALKIGPVALASSVREAVAAVSALFRDKGIELVVDVPRDLPQLLADKVRVRQILINLLANAARYAQRGSVTVTARSVDDAVETSVADTGPGIAPEEADAIFTEYYRAGLGHQMHTSGLGLAICRRLVELHGGRIWATSRLGQGTVFTFSLPPVPSQQAGAADWETWASTGRGAARATLAVLGGDEDVGRLLTRHLDHYAVRHVRSRQEAARLARDGRIHAMFVSRSSDLAPIAGALAGDASARQLPLFACSLTTNQALARSLGAQAYLPKPLTRARLRAALRRLPARPCSFLVVDDDPEVVRLLSRMLETEIPGCDVRRASDGAQALDILAGHRPDAVLLDLLMPGVDGYTVLASMRADPRLAHVPVVIVSAKGSDADHVTGDQLTITRPGGLPAGDVMHLLQLALDALRGVPSHGNDPACPAARVG